MASIDPTRQHRTRRQEQIRQRRLVAALGVAVLVLILTLILALACGKNDKATAKHDTGGPLGKRSESPLSTPSPIPTALRTPTKADPLRLAGYGESVGDCTVFGLYIKCQTEKKIRFHYFTKPSTGLTRPEFFDWPRFLRKDLGQGKYEAVMFMVGANDAQDIKLNGQKLVFGTKPWNEMYAPRVGAVMDLFLDRGAKRVYWVGMPRMGLSGFGPRMAKLNEIYKSEAAKRAPFVEYIDAWTLLDAPATTYQANLRQADGVHLNDAGALKSGGFVLKQIKKDWHIR